MWWVRSGAHIVIVTGTGAGIAGGALSSPLWTVEHAWRSEADTRTWIAISHSTAGRLDLVHDNWLLGHLRSGVERLDRVCGEERREVGHSNDKDIVRACITSVVTTRVCVGTVCAPYATPFL